MSSSPNYIRVCKWRDVGLVGTCGTHGGEESCVKILGRDMWHSRGRRVMCKDSWSAHAALTGEKSHV